MKSFNRIAGVAVALTVLSAQITFAAQHEVGVNNWDYGHMGYGMGIGGWFFGPLMMVLFIAVIIAAVVAVLRLMGVSGAKQPRDNALGLLNERFARGEIDKSEYEERRNALNI